MQALVSGEYAIGFNPNTTTNVTSAIVKVGDYLIVNATFVCTTSPGANVFATIIKTDSSRITLDKNYPTIAHSLTSSSTNGAYVTVESDGELSGNANNPLIANMWYTLSFMVKVV